MANQSSFLRRRRRRRCKRANEHKKWRMERIQHHSKQMRFAFEPQTPKPHTQADGWMDANKQTSQPAPAPASCSRCRVCEATENYPSSSSGAINYPTRFCRCFGLNPISRVGVAPLTTPTAAAAAAAAATASKERIRTLTNASSNQLSLSTTLQLAPEIESRIANCE